MSQKVKAQEGKDESDSRLCAPDDIGPRKNLINTVAVTATSGTVLLGLLGESIWRRTALAY